MELKIEPKEEKKKRKGKWMEKKKPETKVDKSHDQRKSHDQCNVLPE